jgi:hypothetical protein
MATTHRATDPVKQKKELDLPLTVEDKLGRAWTVDVVAKGFQRLVARLPKTDTQSPQAIGGIKSIEAAKAMIAAIEE